MFGLNYFKADASTHVIRTTNGKIRAQGTGLSFFYNAATTSIAAVPISAQEAPFIFNLQTNDFQAITVQWILGDVLPTVRIQREIKH